ncbi:hypothetical protein GCM10028815_03850 [Mariniluteicoccus flavus]
MAGLQTAHQFALDPETVLAVARTNRESDLRPHHVREVPELAMRHLGELVEGDVSVLGHLLETALTDGCVLWLTHVTPERRVELDQLFGEGLVHVVGAERAGMVPIALNPNTVVEAWAHDPRHQGFLRRALEGLDAVRLPRRVVNALDAGGVDFVRHHWFERAVKNPTVIAYVVVLLYSALRALPVSFVKQFHGSLVMLWTIDIVTALPYTWGVIAMVTAKRFLVRAAGIVVTSVTFCLPYVYFWFHGKHYPPYVAVVIAGLVIGGVALEAWKISRDRRIRRQLVETTAPVARAASATH